MSSVINTALPQASKGSVATTGPKQPAAVAADAADADLEERLNNLRRQ